ncbi:MAG: hypothetical protein NW241_09615 [Bacteroidia bacterium]|nr:hypothetical protein [Bacteroidia bacterium]
MKPYLLLLPALLLLAACKPCDDPANPECKNYDPCWDRTETDADFSLLGIFPFPTYGQEDSSIYVDLNRILNPQRVTFRAHQTFESYRWIVGSHNQVITEPEFSLLFVGANINGPLTVTLVGTRTPDSLCFPHDDGIDTVSRTFEIIPLEEARVLGRFEGHELHNPQRRFTVEISLDIEFQDNYTVKNLPEGCPYESSALSFTDEVFASYYRGNTCGEHQMIGRAYAEGDSIRIEYLLHPRKPNGFFDTDTAFARVFIGKKIN